jgi:hypothetical protein
MAGNAVLAMTWSLVLFRQAFGERGYWLAMVPLGIATGATYGIVNEQSTAAVAAFFAVLGVAIVFECQVPRLPVIRSMLDRFQPAGRDRVSGARDVG